MRRSIIGLVAGALGAVLAVASEPMPAAQQNLLVQKHCAVCHTDAARNGGLTLEHFDAAQVDPSLAAMLVSKLRGGAMGASGLPIPEKTTVAALVSALTAEAVGSEQWTVNRDQGRVSASILRTVPAPHASGAPSLYRLALACGTATHEGEVQLSWSPRPQRGTLLVSPDGNVPLKYQVEGEEKMGNGTAGTTGPAAVALYTAATPGKFAMPWRTLTISNLFPEETVVFPFDALAPQARQELAACFTSGPDRR